MNQPTFDPKRRDFLKTAGVATLTAATSVLDKKVSAAPNELVKHAVIGVGGMGKNHVKHRGRW